MHTPVVRREAAGREAVERHVREADGKVAMFFFRDRVRRRDGREAIVALGRGEATIARIGAKQIAAYRVTRERCTHSRHAARTSAASSAGTTPTAAGNAPATAPASPATAALSMDRNRRSAARGATWKRGRRRLRGGRRGGLKGGKARAGKMTLEERSDSEGGVTRPALASDRSL
jgi:hypothetical protein